MAVVQTAIAMIGLVLLTVVPLGEVPTSVGHWLWIALVGGSCGALAGFVLGLWIRYGSTTSPHAPEPPPRVLDQA